MAPMSPDVSIVVTLIDVLSLTLGGAELAETATIEFALCGYGSQIPRIAGNAMYATVTSAWMGMEGSTPPGSFRADLFSNDIITPAGTYYTATIRDGNGDILQVNAYRFTENQNADLSTLTPYDPNQPPPPLPPLITDLLFVMAWAAHMIFPADEYLSFRFTLAGDTTSELDNYQPGNLYTWIIQQDEIGGHSFAWPTISYNMPVVNPAPNGVTVVTAIMGEVHLWPIGPASWYML